MRLRRHETSLLIDREDFTLKLYKDDKVIETYPIAVGMVGHKTPRGIYRINHRAKCPEWQVPNSEWATEAGLKPGTVFKGCTEANPLKERWLGVTKPEVGIGIHGTGDRSSMGKRASHGCIRMLPEDVVELYPRVPLGSAVTII